ncbi:MAG: M20/M25/M40 family metallo-hydrolase [Clostridia bacterium]|nr:M20/M25/M40 family metallo-hydrolase [Clostridia bacterium]
MNENDIRGFLAENAALQRRLLADLCAIPAPSGKEGARAAYILKTLKAWGLGAAYTDEADNVILPLNAENGNALSAIVAHTDTVFPDTEPMCITETEDRMYCPGIGDDTVCVVQLMLCAKYLAERDITPENGLLIVFNSGEEGLGNLRGTRALFRAYGNRIRRFLSFDHGIPEEMVTTCVGSARFRVCVQTAGGHSYTAFGNENAIARIAALVSEIYRTELPPELPGKTTFNVGTISGGTSVNTIAESAEILTEYRSDTAEGLDFMHDRFETLFRAAERTGVRLTVIPVGDRPCARGVGPEAQATLENACAGILTDLTGAAPKRVSGSTDCNIPQSLGIPAVCVPVYRGARSHTREEWIAKNSLLPGLSAAIRFTLMMCQNMSPFSTGTPGISPDEPRF